MNDRYLCRAQMVDNGGWTYGYLYSMWERKYILLGMINDVPNMIRVRHDTICQCTGLKDKHGNLIWENDVVSTPREDGYSLICWSDTEAKWEIHNDTERVVLSFDNYWPYEIEVVGNAIDNPELLEV